METMEMEMIEMEMMEMEMMEAIDHHSPIQVPTWYVTRAAA